MTVESIEWGGLRERIRNAEVSADQVADLIERTEANGDPVSDYFKRYVRNRRALIKGVQEKKD